MCRKLQRAAQWADMDWESNQRRIGLVLSLFHPDTLISSFVSSDGEAGTEKIYLFHCESVPLLHLNLKGKSLSWWTHVRTHVWAHTHPHTRTHKKHVRHRVCEILQCDSSSSRSGFHQQKIHVKGRTAHAESLKAPPGIENNNVLNRISNPGGWNILTIITHDDLNSDCGKSDNILPFFKMWQRP